MTNSDQSNEATPKMFGKAKLALRNLHYRMQHHQWWRIETGLIAGSVFFGLMSGFLGHMHQAAKEQEIADLYQTKSILVAADDLRSGEVISKANTKTTMILASALSSNHLSAKNIDVVLGRPISIDLKKNDPILLSAIQGANELDGIAGKIPPGKRLFTLTVADSAANNGFIKPNDHVDIMAHVLLPERGITTFTILQDTTLISVGRNAVGEIAQKGPASNVSFFVAAKDAEVLAFAQQRGTFSLSLRNPSDVDVRKDSRGVDLEEFLDNEKVHSASGGGTLKVFEKGLSLNGKK